MEKKAAMGATACLIKHLGLSATGDSPGSYKLLEFDLSQYMKLDKAAFEALTLFPTVVSLF